MKKSKSPKPKKPKFRSKLEARIADTLKEIKVPFEYETEKYSYVLPPRKYTIDFKIGTVYLEVKGYLDYDDQLKMEAVKAAHPDLDIRFVFMKPHQRLPRRKETHAEWAERHGFPWIGEKDLNKKWLLT